MEAEPSSSSSSTPPIRPSKPTIGILSMGEMGSSIARLLQAHDYTVLTTAFGRSQSTIDRILSAKVINLPTDEDLVAQADIIFSIVPPRDAVATARRIVEACRSKDAVEKRNERRKTDSSEQAPSLLFVDLNAISPKTVKTIASIIVSETSPTMVRRRSSFSFTSAPPTTNPIPILFLDGAILGPAASRQSDKTWKRPDVITSGPSLHRLDAELAAILKNKHIGPKIGAASTLKACFASINKGLTGICILSYTTASTCGVLPELQTQMTERFPALAALAERGLTSMPPKAYRWVDEMRQIGETFSGVGGFGEGAGGKAVFDGFADIYKLVADETELGKEKTESRKRGRTTADVVKSVEEGLQKKRRTEAGEDLTLTWRSSWT